LYFASGKEKKKLESKTKDDVAKSSSMAYTARTREELLGRAAPEDQEKEGGSCIHITDKQCLFGLFQRLNKVRW
jgi:hypothetical protein